MWKFSDAVVPKELHLNQSLTITPKPNPKLYSSMIPWKRFFGWMQGGVTLLNLGPQPEDPGPHKHLGLQKWQVELLSMACWACPGKGFCLLHLHLQKTLSPVITDGLDSLCTKQNSSKSSHCDRHGEGLVQYPLSLAVGMRHRSYL